MRVATALLLFFLVSQQAHAVIVIMGDSISLGYQPRLQSLLPQETLVHAATPGVVPTNNNRGTQQWLTVDDGETEPRFVRQLADVPDVELIVANIGIHNMRVNDGGAFGTTPEVYGEHLAQIFDVLSTYEVPIIWATTTPIPQDHQVIDHTRQPAYRAEELAVVNDHADAVVDLYAVTVDDFSTLWQLAPSNLHFNFAGSRFLAEQLAPVITSTLVSVPEPSAWLMGLSVAVLCLRSITRE